MKKDEEKDINNNSEITQQENTFSPFTQSLKKKQHDEAKLSSLMKTALDNNEFILRKSRESKGNKEFC